MGCFTAFRDAKQRSDICDIFISIQALGRQMPLHQVHGVCYYFPDTFITKVTNGERENYRSEDPIEIIFQKSFEPLWLFHIVDEERGQSWGR